MKSDRTPNLLADLRAELDADAQAEQARLEAAKAAKAAEIARQAAAAQAAHQAAIQARLEAEARRQALVAQARAEAAMPVAASAVQPIEMAAPIEQPIVDAPVAQLTPPPPRGAGFWLAVVGVPMVCVTAIVVAAIWTHQPAATPMVLPTPAAPILQVVDAPTPDVPLMPTAHTIATPESAPAPVKSVAKPVKRTRTGKRPPPVKRVAPKTTEKLILNDFMGAD